MVNKSNVDIAFDIVSANNGPISFVSLWNRLCEELGISELEAGNKVGSFYTSLLLDGRFINCGDNTWDLRSKYRFDDVSRNIKDIYSEDESSQEDIDIEDLEDDEYDDEEKSGDDEKSQYEPDFDSEENF